MSKHVLVIKPIGDMHLYDLEVNGDELTNLQQIVGGYVQCVDLNEQVSLWCHEEGKMLGLPVNPYATTLWEAAYGSTDVIVGTVAIAGGVDENGELMAVDFGDLRRLVQQHKDGEYLIDAIAMSVVGGAA